MLLKQKAHTRRSSRRWRWAGWSPSRCRPSCRAACWRWCRTAWSACAWRRLRAQSTQLQPQSHSTWEHSACLAWRTKGAELSMSTNRDREQERWLLWEQPARTHYTLHTLHVQLLESLLVLRQFGARWDLVDLPPQQRHLAIPLRLMHNIHTRTLRVQYVLVYFKRYFGDMCTVPGQMDPTKWTQPIGPNQLDPNQSKQLLC